jgi:hypothetical protein
MIFNSWLNSVLSPARRSHLSDPMFLPLTLLMSRVGQGRTISLTPDGDLAKLDKTRG